MTIWLYKPTKDIPFDPWSDGFVQYLCEHLNASDGEGDADLEERTGPDGKSYRVALCLECYESVRKGEDIGWPGYILGPDRESVLFPIPSDWQGLFQGAEFCCFHLAETIRLGGKGQHVRLSIGQEVALCPKCAARVPQRREEVLVYSYRGIG